ncbi:unnamed protein product, partial [Rotaria magnacalcarata]
MNQQQDVQCAQNLSNRKHVVLTTVGENGRASNKRPKPNHLLDAR